MNESYNLEHIRNLAAGFVVDDLTPEEDKEFRKLLELHPELITEVEDLQEVLRQVIDGFVDVEVPAGLLPSIVEQMEAELSSKEVQVQSNNTVGDSKANYIEAANIKLNNTRTDNIKPKRAINSLLKLLSPSPKKIAFGCVALCTLLLYIDNSRLRQNLRFANSRNQELAREFNQSNTVKNLLQNDDTRLLTLEGVNSIRSGSGRMIINQKQQKVLMLFQNLPAPPPGNEYVLWTVVDSKKIHCGKVKPYSWGKASYEVPFTNELYEEFDHPEFSGVVMTLEKNPNVPRPTGTVVMRSSQI